MTNKLTPYIRSKYLIYRSATFCRISRSNSPYQLLPGDSLFTVFISLLDVACSTSVVIDHLNCDQLKTINDVHPACRANVAPFLVMFSHKAYVSRKSFKVTHRTWGCFRHCLKNVLRSGFMAKIFTSDCLEHSRAVPDDHVQFGSITCQLCANIWRRNFDWRFTKKSTKNRSCLLPL